MVARRPRRARRNQGDAASRSSRPSRDTKFMPDENEQSKERKSLDDRAKMTELERIRHSAAHVMATAILRLWPDAQFAYGPPVENGFYYDVQLGHRISPEDFP